MVITSLIQTSHFNINTCRSNVSDQFGEQMSVNMQNNCCSKNQMYHPALHNSYLSCFIFNIHKSMLNNNFD